MPRVLLALPLAVPLLAGCAEGGHLNVLGYTTKPTYDESIRTVHVPIFRIREVQDTTLRGIEFDLTRAVVREIESRTPYKVVDDPCRADTVLSGTIVEVREYVQNRNPFNETRHTDYQMVVEYVWKDNRSGEYLTNPRNGPQRVPTPPPFDPTNPPPPPDEILPVPFRLVSTGRALPELGESTTTGLQMSVNRMAVQTVQMMERPW